MWLSTGEADNSSKVIVRTNRSGRTSSRQYHRPERPLLFSQGRGTSTSTVVVSSTRTLWRLLTCSTAQADRLGEWSQTTGSLPRLRPVSSPCWLIEHRLLVGVE